MRDFNIKMRAKRAQAEQANQRRKHPEMETPWVAKYLKKVNKSLVQMNIPDLFSFTWMVRRTTCAQVGIERPWVAKYLKNKKDNKAHFK